jgi:hypothetical protein
VFSNGLLQNVKIFSLQRNQIMPMDGIGRKIIVRLTITITIMETVNLIMMVIAMVQRVKNHLLWIMMIMIHVVKNHRLRMMMMMMIIIQAVINHLIRMMMIIIHVVINNLIRIMMIIIHAAIDHLITMMMMMMIKIIDHRNPDHQEFVNHRMRLVISISI